MPAAKLVAIVLIHTSVAYFHTSCVPNTCARLFYHSKSVKRLRLITFIALNHCAMVDRKAEINSQQGCSEDCTARRRTVALRSYSTMRGPSLPAHSQRAKANRTTHTITITVLLIEESVTLRYKCPPERTKRSLLSHEALISWADGHGIHQGG